MKIHIYHNNAYDSVVLLNEDDAVVSHWYAEYGVLREALETTDVSEWDNQGREIDVGWFEAGNDLYLVIHEDGEWDVRDRDLLVSRLSFHLGERHPIVRALNA